MTYDRIAEAIARLEALQKGQERPAVLDVLADLTPGQRSVVEMLLSDPRALTIRQVAARLGVHPGTVHTHLRRIRVAHPDLYQEIRSERVAQLMRRHEAALARARAHSDKWFRRQRRRARLYGW